METPAIDLEYFRNQLKEFGNDEVYFDEDIQTWIDASVDFVSVDAFGGTVKLATALWVAHNYVLQLVAQNSGNTGGIPGLSGGILSGTSTGPVSAQWNTAATQEANGGSWNYTQYGQRFKLIPRSVVGGLFVYN